MSTNIENQSTIFNTIIFTLLGIACAVIAIKGFMMPNHFLDGGVTGMAILAHEIFHINIGLVLIILNIPFLIIGYKKMGSSFAIQSMLTVIVLAVALHFINIPTVTSDKVLISFFGGLMMGLGVGFVIRAGAVFDGLEVIADYTQRKLGLTSSEIIIFINSGIFLVAAIFLGIEPAMYSILTFFTATQVADYVVDGFEEYIALHIITKEYEYVKSMIVNDYNKAITVYKGERGYLPGSFEIKSDCDIIMTIATRLEMHRIKQSISQKDPKAFVYVQSIKEVKGGLVKKIRKH